jgi:hypothetical protein
MKMASGALALQWPPIIDMIAVVGQAVSPCPISQKVQISGKIVI